MKHSPTAVGGIRCLRERADVCRSSMNHPPTAVGGIRCLRERADVCRSSMNYPPTAVGGIAELVVNFRSKTFPVRLILEPRALQSWDESFSTCQVRFLNLYIGCGFISRESQRFFPDGPISLFLFFQPNTERPTL